MTTIDYFKLQAKNLHKDFKTQKPYFDPSLGDNLYDYQPIFFDVDALVTDFEIDEENFALMNAQHIIAKLVGFDKWTTMVKASPPALELSKLLFDNMHKIRNEEWEYYILKVENENDLILNDDDKLGIFKMVFADVDGHETDGYDYRLFKKKEPKGESHIIKPKKSKIPMQFTALPLTEADRKEFIDVANEKFEELLQMMEPRSPKLIRNLWIADQYIQEVLKPDILPIDRDYALSLVEAFLINHFISPDTMATSSALSLINKELE